MRDPGRQLVRGRFGEPSRTAAISSARRSSASYMKLMRPRSNSRRPSSIRARRSSPAAAESLYKPRSSRSRYTRRDSVRRSSNSSRCSAGTWAAEFVGNLLGAALRRVAVVVEAASDPVEEDVGPLADRRVREVEAGRQPEAAAGEVLRRPRGSDGRARPTARRAGASPVSSACASGSACTASIDGASSGGTTPDTGDHPS